MRSCTLAAISVALIFLSVAKGDDRAWRPLPLIQDGKPHPDWVQIGYGGFSVNEGALRTDCDPKGMGLLLYQKERFGNCQIRVVYRCENAKSNSGVFVRIDDGIAARVQEKAPAVTPDRDGKLSEAMVRLLTEASDKELGPWYAVHHGYEVQIKDESEPFHRTGAIYSLARAEALNPAAAGSWRTMLITLAGERIRVELDGRQICTFDSKSPEIPLTRQWYEPKREPRRPQIGYIGLQNHDPGDVVWFKEVSVRSAAPERN
jgi:hypothetical protein